MAIVRPVRPTGIAFPDFSIITPLSIHVLSLKVASGDQLRICVTAISRSIDLVWKFLRYQVIVSAVQTGRR